MHAVTGSAAVRAPRKIHAARPCLTLPVPRRGRCTEPGRPSSSVCALCSGTLNLDGPLFCCLCFVLFALQVQTPTREVLDFFDK